MASIGSLVIELAANTARLQSDMGKAVGIAERGAKQLGGAFKAIAGGFLGATLLGAAKQAIALGDDLNKAAIKAGVSGRAISELSFAAKQSDIDLQSLSGALQKMQVALSKAASGGEEQARSLAALGLTIADLQALQPDRQFELLADRISKLRDPADRARAAVELFGKSGADLLPLFEQGAAGIRAAREEAQRLGVSLSDETIAALATADDAVKRLSQSWDAFAAKLTAKVAPRLADLLDALTGNSKALASFLAGFGVASGSVDGFLITFGQSGGSKGPGTRRRGRRGGESAPPGFAAVADPVKAAAAKDIEFTMADIVAANERFGRQIYPIWAEELERTRGDFVSTFGDIERTIADNAKNVTEIFKEQTGQLSTFADQAARNMQDAFADFLFDPFSDGLKGMLKGFIDIIRRMVAEAAAAKIFEALGFGKSGGVGGFLGDILGGIFGGKRESGGPVSSGRAYLVGERGPELFMPRGSGSIVPNSKMGGSVVIAPVYNIDARGATADLAAALPEILKRNNAQLESQIITGLRRRKYAL